MTNYGNSFLKNISSFMLFAIHKSSQFFPNLWNYIYPNLCKKSFVFIR